MEKTVSIDVKKAHPHITWNKTEPLMITLKACIRKIKEPGKAICIICSKSDCIRYAAKGLGVLKQHVKGKGNVQKEVGNMQCFKLPGAASESSSSNSYGAPPIYHGTPVVESNPPPQPMVHLSDGVANMEAMVTAFIAEKAMSFSMAKPVEELAKEIAKNSQALAKLHVSNHSILQDGVWDKQDSEQQSNQNLENDTIFPEYG